MTLFTLGFPDLPDIVPVLQVRSLVCAVGPKMCPASPGDGTPSTHARASLIGAYRSEVVNALLIWHSASDSIYSNSRIWVLMVTNHGDYRVSSGGLCPVPDWLSTREGLGTGDFDPAGLLP